MTINFEELDFFSTMKKISGFIENLLNVWKESREIRYLWWRKIIRGYLWLFFLNTNQSIWIFFYHFIAFNCMKKTKQNKTAHIKILIGTDLMRCMAWHGIMAQLMPIRLHFVAFLDFNAPHHISNGAKCERASAHTPSSVWTHCKIYLDK